MTLVALSVFLAGSVALAQDRDDSSIDLTRLDVERLPPEAIEMTRDLYASGFFAEGALGARSFVGGLGDLGHTGFFASLGFGYEFSAWFLMKASLEASWHATDAPAPPSSTAFQILGALLEARLTMPVGRFVAPFLGGEFGVGRSAGDVLSTYGISQSDKLASMFGGQLGLELHLPSRHYALGVVGGGRLFPSLQGADGAHTVGFHSAVYLHYSL